MEQARDLALVLGGGGALGAIEAGVYEALDQAGMCPTRLAGSSIGAINAAIIAGNPPARRIERLREFWGLVAEPAPAFGPWSGDAANRQGAGRAAGPSVGRPGLDRPSLPQLFLQEPRLASPSLYDPAPVLATLGRLVDFEVSGRSGPGWWRRRSSGVSRWVWISSRRLSIPSRVKASMRSSSRS